MGALASTVSALLRGAVPALGAAALTAALTSSTPARAATPVDDIDVMLTKEQALEFVFAEADEVLEMRVILDEGSANRIGALARRSLDEGGFYVYRARRGSELLGYAVVVSQVGKVRPITHIVEVTPEGVIDDLAVMIYRESHGMEVADRRFCDQYRGKTLDDSLRIEADIINIAGATLSGHALCRGARKALATVQVLFLDASPDQVERLVSQATDVTPASLRRSGGGSVPGAPRGGVAAGDAAAGNGSGASIDTSGLQVESDAEGRRVRVEGSVMGTVLAIELRGDDGVHGDALLEAAVEAFREVERWDDVLSDWDDTTPLSRFNAAGPGRPHTVDPGLLAWLEHAMRAHELTEGRFDPTVGSLVEAWGLRTRRPRRPEPGDLSAAFDASGLFHIELDHEAGTLMRTHRRTTLDPGGSGKGWALDHAAERLRRRGVTSGLLSFDSTLLSIGPPPGGDGWLVPVVHDGAGREVARVTLERGALSVSGGGFSTFDDGGIERGHVIDPGNGVPVPATRLAWVLHDTAADADALSTALLVAGPDLTPVAGAHGVYLESPDATPHAWTPGG